MRKKIIDSVVIIYHCRSLLYGKRESEPAIDVSTCMTLVVACTSPHRYDYKRIQAIP